MGQFVTGCVWFKNNREENREEGDDVFACTTSWRNKRKIKREKEYLYHRRIETMEKARDIIPLIFSMENCSVLHTRDKPMGRCELQKTDLLPE